MYIFGISEQFAARESTILIYRATSNFDFHMRIFNLQGLGSPNRPKKNYAIIDFTSLHSFLRLRKVKKNQFEITPYFKNPPNSSVQCIA
jgi:hypothetical protein